MQECTTQAFGEQAELMDTDIGRHSPGHNPLHPPLHYRSGIPDLV